MLTVSHVIGRLVRLPLRAIAKSTVVPILSGPSKGLRWTVGAGQHSCWLGTYESHFARLIAKLVRPGMLAFDVGAHSGYFTLILSRLVGETGKVISFEPSQRRSNDLRRHIELNNLSNVVVVEAAVSDRSGTAFFNDLDYTGHLSQKGRPVDVVRLDDYPVPDFVKMDIEGAEVSALEGAGQILSAQRTIWLVAFHGVPAKLGVIKLLANSGLAIEWIRYAELLARPVKDVVPGEFIE
jgi:FkbM family methyltransferase